MNKNSGCLEQAAKVGQNGHENQLTTQPTFTPNHYNKILQMINKEDSQEYIANTAGTYKLLFVYNTKAKRKDNEDWIIDSGATRHMTSKETKLDYSVSVKDLDKQVHLPNGQATSVTQIGSCKVSIGDTLTNLLVVPDFKYDFLSVSQLTRQLNCSVNFFPEFCVFQDLSNGKVKGIGKERNVLYYLPSQIPKRDAHDEQNTLISSMVFNSEGLKWHNRLGHPSMKVLKSLSLIKGGEDINECNNCPV